LKELFNQYTGLLEIRVFKDKYVGMITYETEDQATKALTGLQGFSLAEGFKLNISFSN